MALKIIKDLDNKENHSEEIRNRIEPFVIGELTNWGGIEVGYIESRYSDRFVCLETPAEMLEAYKTQYEYENRLRIEKMDDFYN